MNLVSSFDRIYSVTSAEIRQKFLEFFEKRGHKIVPSSSLLPENDPSVLLTSAGMQQFKPYYTGDKDSIKDFGSRRTVSIQKSFRTSDIDEVGDESHLTFFQMLGHFSFGDYFKKETIEWTFELLTKVFGIDEERISVSVFEGDKKIPEDQESYDAWLRFLPAQKIKLGSREDGNVWGPAGSEGPCGACNEVYVDGGEVATLVFMEFYLKDNIFIPLKQKGVDVGWGLERLTKAIQSAPTVFETDLFEPLIQLISHKNVKNEARVVRIIVDHIRGATFLITDGILPSNMAQGYILRRLLRRAIRYGKVLNLDKNFLIPLAKKVIEMYKEFYPELSAKREDILTVIQKEEEKFSKTLKNGLRELEKMLKIKTDKIIYGEPDRTISGNDAFYLYESYGFPMELTREIAKERGFSIDESGFKNSLKRHQDISRAGAEKKFGGHGIKVQSENLKVQNLENIDKITRLHTATHLLHQALHDVLGSEAEVKQMGSDITEERTRFDFTFGRKLTPQEIKKIEDIVSEKIKLNLPVICQKMSKEKALKFGARAFFKEKYPDEVNVYSVGDPDLTKAYSKEFCDGPHVKSTGEIGIFKIIKEESSSAGVRRIRAVVEE